MRAWPLRLLLLGVVGAVASGGYVVVSRAPTPHAPDYRTAVMRVLDQQGVPYRDVLITDGCAPTYQLCRTYAGTVRVVAEVDQAGQIACAERWTDCTLSVPGLRIVAAPLADTRDLLAWRWQVLWGQAIQWLQALW